MSRDALSPREVLWVSAALVLALSPHMLRFPSLLCVAFVGAVLWRMLGALGRLPLPDRQHRALWIAKQAVAVLAFVSIYVAYHGRLGREAGVELLAALLGLKLLEMRSDRDYYIVTFLCYFLVVTNFFYSQTMQTALYMLFVVIVVTAVLIQFNTPREYQRVGGMLRLSTVMSLQAMPLMLLAFVLFPRIPGPLWGLPQDAFDAVSGLSEEMSIGHITRLGLSSEIAFRVEFRGAAPRARELYWRGPVLWKTDGRTWRAGDFGRRAPGAVERLGPLYRYSVSLEPHRNRWLMGLEMVTTASAGIRRSGEMGLLASQPVRRRLTYDLESAVAYRIADITAEERHAALALPFAQHPRSRELAATWAARASDPEAVVNSALDYFRVNKFYYSLTPPALPRDAVDEFLFDTREGFCEHFASSFVVLMRAAGIPARVVTGYQGGEYNDVGEYMVIRQRDAHAWAEVYFDDRGWVRVDPTAAVAPERVSLGFADALPRGAELSAFARRGVASRFWTRLRNSFDAVTYGWNQWVLGYTPQQQQRLLDDLGLEDWDYGNLVIALTLCLAAVTSALAIVLLRAQRRDIEPAVAAYLAFCAKLSRLGFQRAASEPPLAFARRVSAARADLAADVMSITRLYTHLRYGRVKLDSRLLRTQVRRFRPSRLAP